MGGFSTIPSHGRFMAARVAHIVSDYQGLCSTREHVHRVLLRRLLTEMKTGDDETTRTFRPLGTDLFPGSSRTFSETIWIHRVWFFQPINKGMIGWDDGHIFGAQPSAEVLEGCMTCWRSMTLLWWKFCILAATRDWVADVQSCSIHSSWFSWDGGGLSSLSAWWFGTVYIFPNIWDDDAMIHSHELIFFRGGGETTN